MGRLFGTDGVRGVAGTEITEDLARALGTAAVLVLGASVEGPPTFVVGRDPRASGGWIERALVEGIRDAGGDVVLMGVVPTPAVAFHAVRTAATAGVVISASHNPPEDNGIKFFGPDGAKLSDALEDAIELALDRSPADPGSGHVRHAGADALDAYVEHLVGAAAGRLDGLTVVVDCANGAASAVAPDVYRRLGAEVHAIHAEPDGSNINVGCGALHPEIVAAEVVRLGADAGVTHDGDADRALFADAAGNVIDGDQVLAACALSLHEDGLLPGRTVVTTVMANLGFLQAMGAAGIEVVTTQVGDRYVLEAMREAGARLGGEQSGHLLLLDHATTGDGLLTAVRFLSLAARRGEPLAALAGVMRRYPQVMVNVEVRDRDGVAEAPEVEAAIRAARDDLGDAGRVVVRPSGTEPVIRVMVEAETHDRASRHADAVASAVRGAMR